MSTQIRRVNYPLKIIALWTAFLLGMLFHTQLALMPLFHGIDIADSHTHDYLPLTAIFWFMLSVFGVAMAAIIATALIGGKSYRKFHFGLTLVYSLINAAHLILDVMVQVPLYQLFLMAYLFIIGLILNVVSYQWFYSELNQQPVLRSAH